jgi:ribonucleoside-triphosphate reductase
VYKRQALLGCGICGWMNNPSVLLNEENMREGAALILQINKEIVDIFNLVGISMNVAARATCVKPDGNTGVLLQAASGVHGEEASHLFRLMQINKESEIAKYLQENYPVLVEESVWSATQSDIVLYVPVEPSPQSIFKKDLVGVKQLEIVRSIQQNWVEYGTNVNACVQPFLRHNVSNTVQVENWEEVGKYLYDNRQYFSGVSFLGIYGALDFKQAPFTPVLMPDELLAKYGDGAMFASGLIVDGLHYFDGDLWDALSAVVSKNVKLGGNRSQVLLKKDWIRRAKQFAKRYCKNDIQTMTYCLKSVHLYHKWCQITRALAKPIDLSKVVLQPHYTDADTLGSASCIGGACEMPSYFTEQMNNPKG